MKQNPNLLISSADKGKREKMHILLEDNTTYNEIKKSSINEVKLHLNKMVSDQFDKNKIDKITMNKLKNLHGNEPRMYGLPKIHKPDLPMHPIVDYIGSPLYELSSFLGDVLKPSVGNTAYSIKNLMNLQKMLNSSTFLKTTK